MNLPKPCHSDVVDAQTSFSCTVGRGRKNPASREQAMQELVSVVRIAGAAELQPQCL